MKPSVKTRSGASIPCLTKREAAARNLLTREELYEIHLLPGGEPAAYSYVDENTVIYFFNPDAVVEAPPELWFGAKNEPLTLPSGTVIPRMSVKRAAAYGYYTRERLSQMHCETVEEPVA